MEGTAIERRTTTKPRLRYTRERRRFASAHPRVFPGNYWLSPWTEVSSMFVQEGLVHAESPLVACSRRFLILDVLFARNCRSTTQRDSKSQGSLERMDFGKTPDGTPVELYVLSNGKMTAKVMTYGAIVTELDVPDRNGKLGRRRPRLRQSRRLPGRPSLFRRHHRPRRQPDRQGPIHARRQGIQARRQQRAELAARRPEGVRQGRLEGRGRLRAEPGRPSR